MKKPPRSNPSTIRIVEMPVEKLKPFAGNPRKISDEAYSGLKESIQRWGMVQPILFNEATGRVVGGHQRLRVLIEKGETTTPVIVVDVPDETEEKALNVALNNPRIQGEFTADLEEILAEIENLLPDVYDLMNMPGIQMNAENEPDSDDSLDKPIIPEMELLPFESYDYLVILSRDRMDFDFLCERFGIDKVNSSKIPSRKKIGLGRVVDAKKVIALLENPMK